MRRTEAIALLLSHADELRAAGVAHVSMFGSIARDECDNDSDLDLVVDGPPDRPMTLFGLARAQAVLERVFDRRIDLTARAGLEKATEFRRQIAADLVHVF